MDLNDLGGFALLDFAQMNIILGKNGCGKSHFLKRAEQHMRDRPNTGLVRYISPERAGYAVYEPGVEHSMSGNPEWMNSVRRNNQSDNFKQQSAVLYRRLETMVLREIEADRSLPGFDGTIDEINSLLDRVRIERAGSTFSIVDRGTGQPTTAREISSGESELLSLAIEMMAFRKECVAHKHNYLLVDEPDVHLHPDLQHRLAQFLTRNLEAENISVFIATHSTALLGAFADDERARVVFMKRGDTMLRFHPITEAYRNILPIFGAHPLSNVFNAAPILLVEGEDDDRLWQQAIRSSKGRIKVFPCPVEGISELTEYEADANEIIASVYDDAVGYSIRDRDTDPEHIDDLGNVVRMRLSCRAAENLMLADETLAMIGTNWDTTKVRLAEWLELNSAHIYFADVLAFSAEGFDRKNADLKTIRNIIVGLLTNKPWEVLVGQAIAKITAEPSAAANGSLRDYLGSKICKMVLGIN